MAREVVTLYTLFIDTHNKNVLIILFKDGKVLSCEDLVTTNKHSEVAMPTIDKLLKDVNVDVSELGKIKMCNCKIIQDNSTRNSPMNIIVIVEKIILV